MHLFSDTVGLLVECIALWETDKMGMIAVKVCARLWMKGELKNWGGKGVESQKKY